ncbi:hypothetical protein DFH09DRAFT_3630 [Mycena vulgaris]|nr:hypothetical protein DFH09DRAFT_3630 [Mycena vulgaris]
MSGCTIDVLPDEILAAIFKLVADDPITSGEAERPFPLAASHVNRHRRTVAITSPELWANIRISRRSWSWKLANIFIQRSGSSHPLDISGSLESYTCAKFTPPKEAWIPTSSVLDVIGPHIHRWRRISLRGWKGHFTDLRQFISNSPIAPARPESVHFSLISKVWGDPCGPDGFNLEAAPLSALRLNFG